MNPMVLLLDWPNLDMPGRRAPDLLVGGLPSESGRAAPGAIHWLGARGLLAALMGIARRASGADRG